jgi:tetratricopeptide (TPR) repeat protein
MTNIEGFNPVDVIPVDVIPAELLKETVSIYRTEEQKKDKWDAKLLGALERLVNLGLLEWAGREDVEGYAMHTLTSAFVRARAIAATHKANSTQDPDPSEKAKDEQQAKDLQKKLDSAQGDVERLIHKLARECFDEQDIVPIIKLFAHFRVITDRSKESESFYSPGLCALLAFFLYVIGDVNTSPKLYVDYALKSCEKAQESSFVASVLYILAETMILFLGEYSKAKNIHERALQIREKGTNQQDIVESLDGMSIVLRYLGEYKEALPYAQRAVAVREQNTLKKVLSASHSRLGLLLLDMGMDAEAKDCLAKALEIDEKKNQESLGVAVDLDNLAMVMTELKEYATARAQIERSMAILRKTFQSDDPINPDMAIAYRILGKLLYAQGNLSEARTYFERALAIHGENYLQAATRSIHQLLAAYVLLLKDQGDHSEA